MDSLIYKETGANFLSFDRFTWKELTVQGVPGFRGSSAGGSASEAGAKEKAFAGGFHYRGSALVTSSCRNRFILW